MKTCCLVWNLQRHGKKVSMVLPGDTFMAIQEKYLSSSLCIKSVLLVYANFVFATHISFFFSSLIHDVFEGSAQESISDTPFLSATASLDCLFLPSLILQLSDIDVEGFISPYRGVFASCCVPGPRPAAGCCNEHCLHVSMRVLWRSCCGFRFCLSFHVCCGLNMTLMDLFKNLNLFQQNITFITYNLHFNQQRQKVIR